MLRRPSPDSKSSPGPCGTFCNKALLVALLGLFLALPMPADAYIGPGAGFALVTSFLAFFVTFVLALAGALIWPFRTLWRLIRRRKMAKPWIKRLIILGLDGQDPQLTKRFLAEGKLPNFAKLAANGCFHSLRTTFPSVSPVAWSTFSTGVHPARHNIFDFLDRDLRTYLPRLSSTDIGGVNRILKLGSLRIPIGKPELRLLRKSKPFWKILGDHSIWSTVLRVPITFPPDRFYGAQLSAMCVPDLLGTQGTFLLFTTRPAEQEFQEGGKRILLTRSDDPKCEHYQTRIEGPENIMRAGNPLLALPMEITVDRDQQQVEVRIDGDLVKLEPGQLSDWVQLVFPVIPLIKANGICRMMVTEMDEHFSLYMTPINIDPEKPAMPISHPSYYAPYLEKRIGPYATLGLAEDTWARNEKVTDDATFLEQAWDIHHEREEMFFGALDRLRRGSLVCVFDGTDRIQHMFWRHIDKDHPAARGDDDTEHANAIEELYIKNDELVGKVMGRLGKGDVLMVVSDHGFTSFRRGINLNVWLLQEGYLALKEGADGSAQWLRDVDWSKTRVYSVGLTGMFINRKGREGSGIVEPGAESQQLKAEIIAKLSGFKDTETGEVAIKEVFDTSQLYSGPYLRQGPDFLIGYNRGYRISWDGAGGVVSGPMIEDNVKAWSGDHCVDPRLVPGIFFSNCKIDDDDPGLIDIAPTALRLFGVPPSPHMEGKPLYAGSPFATDRPTETPEAPETPETSEV